MNILNLIFQRSNGMAKRYTDLPIDPKFGRLTKVWTLLVVLLLVAGICFLNYTNETKISFYIFYSLPIFIATWYIGGWAGILISFACTVAWWIVDLKNSAPQLIHYIDSSLRLIFFISISVMISYLHVSLIREKKLADTDYLTGLLNRRVFIEKAGVEAEKAKKHGRPFTMVYIDLDNFKPVNDRYGHTVGDNLLKQIASELKNNLRMSDIVARMGGDEFVIFLPNTNEKESAAALSHLQTCLNTLSENSQMPVTFTIGAITYEKTYQSTEEMIKAVDRVMYAGKQAGKNMIKHIHARDLLVGATSTV